MAAVDRWPDNEGYIFEGCMVLPCYAAGAISEMEPVILSTTSTGYIVVDHGAGTDAMCLGVCLRAATAAGDIVPVAFNGVVKMTAACTITVGDCVISATTTGTPFVCGLGAAGDHKLGVALQAGGTTGDEILVLLTGGDKDA